MATLIVRKWPGEEQVDAFLKTKKKMKLMKVDLLGMNRDYASMRIPGHKQWVSGRSEHKYVPPKYMVVNLKQILRVTGEGVSITYDIEPILEWEGKRGSTVIVPKVQDPESREPMCCGVPLVKGRCSVCGDNYNE